MKPVRIKTKRLFLRDLAPADRQPLEALAAQREVTRHLLLGPSAVDEVQPFLEGALREQTLEPRRSWTLAICHPKPSTLVGAIRFTEASTGNGELACFLDPEVWGQGFAAEAIRPVVDLAGQQWGLARAIAEVDASHVAARAAIEKARFRLVEEVPGDRVILGKRLTVARYERPLLRS